MNRVLCWILPFYFVISETSNSSEKCVGFDMNATNVKMFSGNLRKFPTCVFDMKYLTFLELSGNQIQIIPESIGKLINLQHLDLDRNQIQIIPESIGKLINLQRLYLRWNQIQVIPISLKFNKLFVNLISHQYDFKGRTKLTVFDICQFLLQQNALTILYFIILFFISFWYHSLNQDRRGNFLLLNIQNNMIADHNVDRNCFCIMEIPIGAACVKFENCNCKRVFHLRCVRDWLRHNPNMDRCFQCKAPMIRIPEPTVLERALGNILQLNDHWFMYIVSRGYVFYANYALIHILII